MQRKDIFLKNNNQSRRNSIQIPAPIVAGTVTCQYSQSMYRDNIRIDTGADISILPGEVRHLLGLLDKHAIYSVDAERLFIGRVDEGLVFLVDFEFPDFKFKKVHVVFGSIAVPLFGIWTGLERSDQLMCNFRNMETKFK